MFGTGIGRRLLGYVMILALLAGCAIPAQPPRTSPTQPPEPTATPQAAIAAQPDYWPTQGWRVSTPEQQGIDPAVLAQAFDAISSQQLSVESLLVIRNGYLAAEAYFQPYGANTRHQVASVTKSIMSALVGIAIDKGHIKSVRQPVLDFFPGRQVAHLDANKQAMTLEDLLTMSHGLDCSDDAGTYNAMMAAPDWVQFTLDLPMKSEPGTRFAYCSPVAHLISAILQQATGKNARDLANLWLMAPLGVRPLGNDTWQNGTQEIPNGCCGVYLTPRDMAKFGLLYLQQGRWDGLQIVPAAWVAASSARHATMNPARDYGYLFWEYPLARYYSAMGKGGQQIYVIAEKNMVVVMTGSNDQAGEDAMTKVLDDYIIPAARSNAPLPADPDGAATLAAKVSGAAHPIRPVPALPAFAAQISGKTFTLEPNAQNWHALTLRFDPGSSVAVAVIDGTISHDIGLDNVYRPSTQEGAPITEARGRWEEAGAGQAPGAAPAFVAEVLTLGEWTHQELRITWDGDAITLVVREKVLGLSAEMHGTAAAKN